VFCLFFILAIGNDIRCGEVAQDDVWKFVILSHAKLFRTASDHEVEESYTRLGTHAANDTESFHTNAHSKKRLSPGQGQLMENSRYALSSACSGVAIQSTNTCAYEDSLWMKCTVFQNGIKNCRSCSIGSHRLNIAPDRSIFDVMRAIFLNSEEIALLRVIRRS